MTIDSGWVKTVKLLVPQAFRSTCPFKPSVVFIDGQIKLMAPSSIYTWDAYFERQFLNSIEYQFKTGANIVVLGFDDYRFVPAAKAPTQRKRNTHVPTVAFEDKDDLPTRPPDAMGGAMRNRSFKMKVISFIVRRLRIHYENERHKTVILDWMDAPEVLGKTCPLPRLFQAADTTATEATEATEATVHEDPVLVPAVVLKRGECDIKAFVWAELGPLLIISTDGDFVPMSLLQCERAPHVRIALYRMQTNMNSTPTKRSASGTHRRTYEYVDINMVHAGLCKELSSSTRPATLFAVMTMLTGCDFCANLPSIGPARVWKCRHQLSRIDVNSQHGVLYMMCLLYLETFHGKIGISNHVVRAASDKTSSELYAQIAASVLRGTVNARSRTSFWSTSRAITHSRNVQWTLEYWTCLHEYPDPVQQKYGFVRVKNVVQVAP